MLSLFIKILCSRAQDDESVALVSYMVFVFALFLQYDIFVMLDIIVKKVSEVSSFLSPVKLVKILGVICYKDFHKGNTHLPGYYVCSFMCVDGVQLLINESKEKIR